MRFAAICLICLLTCCPLQSQATDIAEIARRSATAALPHLSAAGDPSATLLRHVDTTALGCKLIDGLPLATPIDVYRLAFPLDDSRFAIQVSADGSMAQPCDERFPNLGAGTIPVAREQADSDGDGLIDSADACPQIAGLTASEKAGCPQSSDEDRDGDGSPDARDHCPDQPGSAEAYGCALLRDEDGDGIPDRIDTCPADFGVIRPDFALGCPADGSGSSPIRRGTSDICRPSEAVAIYAERAGDADIIGRSHASQDDKAAGTIIGRTAAKDWYQLASGWVKAAGLQLVGFCFNIPLVNAAVGSATGCFMRPRGDFANVREAPRGRQVTRVYSHETPAVLGRNFAADWLFYRAGWVKRAILELSGRCDHLPALDPAKAAAGTVHFCPPGYDGFLRPRIDIGKANARVASDVLANRLRAQPDIGAEQIGEIPPRAILDAVLDGPACNGPFIWWQVNVDGGVGWTVESDVNANHYYLEPVDIGRNASQADAEPADRWPAENEQPAAERIIHSANTAALDTIKLLTINAPRTIAWSPFASRLAVLTQSGTVALYSYPDFAPIAGELALPDVQGATAIAFSPDAKALAIGNGGGEVFITALTDNAPLADAISLGEQPGPIRGLAWSSAGDKLAAISGDESLKLARRAGTLKLWDLSPASPGESRLAQHFNFPYPATAVAFSADDRLLAVTGESSRDERAGLWIYAAADGELLFMKALVFMRGAGWVLAAPDAALGDFVYNSGDSLYQITVDSAEDKRIYHQAGSLLPRFTFRRQVIANAEALLAVITEARNGPTRLRIVNALNAYSPSASLRVEAAAIGFSPDGRALAIVESEKDRVLILGVMQGSGLVLADSKRQL